MLIVRYLISDTHFLEATVETDRPLNEDCRRHVLALVKSVQLLDPDGSTPADDSPPPREPSPAPEKTPAPPPDAVPLDLHPTRAGSEPAPSDLDATAGVAATKEQGVDEQRVELP